MGISARTHTHIHAHTRHRTNSDAPQAQEEPTHVIAHEDIREAFSGVSRDAEATVRATREEWGWPTDAVSLVAVDRTDSETEGGWHAERRSAE